jgi:hypothetical protein
MDNWSLEPDEHMRWIYDTSHRDYHSPMAEDLREARRRALCQLPEWMKAVALSNDARRERERNKT